MKKALAVEIHTRAGNTPEIWRSCAGDLLAAARVLLNHREGAQSDEETAGDAWRVHPSELMLRGMAMECLLKALWVKRGNKLVEHGEFIAVPNAGPHDLVQLAQALQIKVSGADKHLLQRLSHFIEYGGRYPVPKSAQKLQLIRYPQGGRGGATTWTTPGDYRLFQAIVDQLEGLLNEQSA